jgi:hypothetical protein
MKKAIIIGIVILIILVIAGTNNPQLSPSRSNQEIISQEMSIKNCLGLDCDVVLNDDEVSCTCNNKRTFVKLGTVD